MTYVSDSVPTYCTVEDIEETMDLPSPDDPLGTFKFSDMSHPSYDRVTKMILAAEDEIDRRSRNTWRVNYVKDYTCSIQDYWHDENALRHDYFRKGGDYVQLHRNVLEWDPELGDKLEIRTTGNFWRDATISYIPFADADAIGYSDCMWFDYPRGKMYLRTRLFQAKDNALRISYRYGSTEPVPAGINRLCSLIVASKIIVMSVYDTKLGMGGDISGVKNQLLNEWKEEIGELYSSFQRAGTVHSLLR